MRLGKLDCVLIVLIVYTLMSGKRCMNCGVLPAFEGKTNSHNLH